jgi:RNA polymerase sigma-70 factor (ECF subfamily)
VALSPDALEDAYTKYGHLVLRRCRLILRDPTLAQDAMQEVFLKLFRYGDKLPEAENPLSFVYRTTERVCFDLLRGRARAPDAPEVAPSNPAELVAPRSGGYDDLEVVIRFLERFDDKMRRLALMHYVDELPQDRIADELGWSRQTVNKKVGQLKKKAEALKKRLGVEHD